MNEIDGDVSSNNQDNSMRGPKVIDDFSSMSSNKLQGMNNKLSNYREMERVIDKVNESDEDQFEVMDKQIKSYDNRNSLRNSDFDKQSGCSVNQYNNV